ncbi:SGF11 [Candida margitis]|uniref:SGF11 n=1 Tax=Candida margitis TaxID=1775924 RepID=UPI0022273CF6|nr:SGF11 [Candida margitis]KAI5969801.1 SGF11 [Candida margitis]
MIAKIIKQQVVNTYSDYMTVEKITISDPQIDQLLTNFNQSKDINKDIFGQDKTKLKTSETSRYFSCENCGRKIAGGRFAQHVNKCLERRRRP